MTLKQLANRLVAKSLSLQDDPEVVDIYIVEEGILLETDHYHEDILIEAPEYGNEGHSF